MLLRLKSAIEIRSTFLSPISLLYLKNVLDIDKNRDSDQLYSSYTIGKYKKNITKTKSNIQGKMAAMIMSFSFIRLVKINHNNKASITMSNSPIFCKNKTDTPKQLKLIIKGFNFLSFMWQNQ